MTTTNSIIQAFTTPSTQLLCSTIDSVLSTTITSRDVRDLILCFSLFDDEAHTFENASKNGNVDVLRNLIRYGQNAQSHAEVALNAATAHGQLHVIRFLIDECEVVVNQVLCVKLFVSACSFGQLNIARFWKEKESEKVLTRTAESMWFAAKNHHLNVVKFLVKECGGVGEWESCLVDSSITVKEMKEYARSLGMKGYSKMRKMELVVMLVAWSLH